MAGDPTVRIRMARPADAPALAALRYEFRRVFLKPGSREGRAAFVRRCALWMRRALGDRQRWRCWVAVTAPVARSARVAATSAAASAEIVGHIWVQTIDKVPNPGREAERHAYVTNLYVRASFRGGTGQRLLDAAMAWCQAQGTDSVILWPTEESRSLYARNGFSISGDLLVAWLPGDHLKESLSTRAKRRPARMARSSAKRRALVR